VLFPIARRSTETLAPAWVASRIVESTIIAVGAISLLTIVPVRSRATLILFDVVDPGDATDVLAVPEIVWEAALGLYPLIRGSGRRRHRSPATRS
jgi:hypothetical protein